MLKLKNIAEYAYIYAISFSQTEGSIGTDNELSLKILKVRLTFWKRNDFKKGNKNIHVTD